MIDAEFYRLIKDIVSTKEYQKMKGYRHHVRSSAFYHSLKTAYLCYKHHKRFKSKMNLKELVRGALLHDYYLYDRHKKDNSHRFHGFTHPKRALENALRAYPDLTRCERDMIKYHMFPLTILPPRTKMGWLICFYDKVAAVSDYFGKNRWKKQE